MDTKKILQWGLVVVVLAALVGGILWWQMRTPSSESVARVPKRPEEALLAQLAELSRQDGDLPDMLVQAEGVFTKLVTDFPESPEVENARAIMEDLHVRLLFSSVPTEDSEQYEVNAGDTLSAIARRYHTTVELLMKANGLQDDRIRVGQILKVNKAVFNVLVDKSDNRLWLRKNEDIVKTYTVSTGANGITPIGKFVITDKLINPVWYKAGAVVPPDSPDNILGTRWMGISVPGYGIHGTTEPEALGEAVTNGCVRMSNASVEELYVIVPAGSEVSIVD
ncbi:MAG: L,D-transpeptidase family protein [Candidatus Omnitrophica bacterium]|nr:L,D-transpeptidase family protein [Candidatus Omnitrophota bacterium]